MINNVVIDLRLGMLLVFPRIRLIYLLITDPVDNYKLHPQAQSSPQEAHPQRGASINRQMRKVGGHQMSLKHAQFLLSNSLLRSGMTQKMGENQICSHFLVKCSPNIDQRGKESFQHMMGWGKLQSTSSMWSLLKE